MFLILADIPKQKDQVTNLLLQNLRLFYVRMRNVFEGILALEKTVFLFFLKSCYTYKVNKNENQNMKKIVVTFSVAFIATLFLAQTTFAVSDGSIKSTIEINDTTTNGPALGDSDKYGVGAASIGDLDNDGVDDIVVGAHGDDTGGTGRGAVYIHFMNTDGSVKSTAEINSLTTNGPIISDYDL